MNPEQKTAIRGLLMDAVDAATVADALLERNLALSPVDAALLVCRAAKAARVLDRLRTDLDNASGSPCLLDPDDPAHGQGRDVPSDMQDVLRRLHERAGGDGCSAVGD